MIENEFESRLIIPFDKYQLLLNKYLDLFPNTKSIVQTNFYFDTDEQNIIKSGSVLRIRVIEETNKIQITYKQAGKNGDKEFTQFLTSKEQVSTIRNTEIFPDGDAINALNENGYSGNQFSYCGEIKTTRYEFHEKDGLVVLDKNEFSGTIDYNLEVESNSKEAAIKMVKELCDEFGIVYKSDDVSKSKRAVDAYLKSLK